MCFFQSIIESVILTDFVPPGAGVRDQGYEGGKLVAPGHPATYHCSGSQQNQSEQSLFYGEKLLHPPITLSVQL